MSRVLSPVRPSALSPAETGQGRADWQLEQPSSLHTQS